LVPVDPNVPHEPALGVSTLAGNTLYLHLHQWPVADEVLVKAAGEPVLAGLDGCRAKLEVGAGEKGVLVRGLPSIPPAGPGPWIVAVEFRAPPAALAARPAGIPECAPGESAFLSPLAADRSTVNGVITPALNRFANGNVSMGSLHKTGDTLTWTVRVPSDGAFDVLASFGSIRCQDNAGFELSCGSSAIHGRTWLTEHYSLPIRKGVGRLQLAKGENQITLRVTDVPNGAFSDVHGIWLIPVQE
jgi:hypothetical protein